MEIKLQYINLIERSSILESNKDKYLIEEQNITEGNFLIFSDTKPTDPSDPTDPAETVTIPKTEYETLLKEAEKGKTTS